MARNRQRAKERKQRQKRDPDSSPDLGLPEDEGSGLPDASSSVFPSLGGAPPGDRGTSAPPVDFDDEDNESGDDGGDAQHGTDAEPVAKRKGNVISRIPGFLRACWAELQRVQWPDRKQVGQATAVVLGFVVIAGAFLGLADVLAQKLVDFIL